MFFLFFWSVFFAAGRLFCQAREVVVDDADSQIIYSAQVGSEVGLNWTADYICQSCRGPLSLQDAMRSEVTATTYNGSWHTARGSALQSNATLSFEGSRISASFIAFQRDVARVEPGSIREAELKFFIDNRLVATTRVSWSTLAAERGQASFIPNLTLFDQPVEPGPHVLTLQYDTGGATERDTSLALDAISYWTVEDGSESDPPSPITPVPVAATRKSNKPAIIAGSVVGGIAFLAFLAFALFWWLRRRSRQPPPVALRSGVTAESNPWSRLSDIDELTEISSESTNSLPSSSPETRQIPRPPSAALSVQTLSTLSIFSRPGVDLNGLPSPQTGHRSMRESMSSFYHASYRQQWARRSTQPDLPGPFTSQV